MAYDFNQRFNRTGDSFLLQDTDLRGGFRTVASIAERDAIPLLARKVGMVVRVISALEGAIDYTILPGKPITNAGWTVQAAGGGGGGGGVADGIDFVVAKMTREGDQVVYRAAVPMTPDIIPEGTDPFDVPPEVERSYDAALCFNNGYENTVEINVHSGQIVARREVGLSSDVKDKYDIQPISGAVGKILKLEGITFDRKDGERRYCGLRAQDVLAVMPEATDKMKDGTLTVFYGSLMGLLVQGFKQLHSMVIKNRRDVKTLKQELEQLRAELEELRGTK